jgi:hypothetical protein
LTISLARASALLGQSALAVLAIVSCVACKSVYGGAFFSSPDLEEGSADLQGAYFGGEVGERYSAFLEGRISEDSSVEVEAYEVLFGGRGRFAEVGRLSLGAQIDVGYARADVEEYPNENDFVSFGAGIFGEVALHQTVSLFVFGGGRYYIDVTPPTTCNDGTTSQSTGSGTCSHHGGIDHYNAKLGDGAALEFGLGVRFRF